jgi:hypothetical protein
MQQKDGSLSNQKKLGPNGGAGRHAKVLLGSTVPPGNTHFVMCAKQDRQLCREAYHRWRVVAAADIWIDRDA